MREVAKLDINNIMAANETNVSVKPATRKANSGDTLFGSGGGYGLPMALASTSPLSVFQYSLSRFDRLNLYRHFARTEPFVGRAIEMHSELPMSRISLGPPKGPNHKQNKTINRVYETMIDRIKLYPFLLEVSRELWLTGDCFIWLEWDDEIHQWKDLYIIPCEYCHAVLSPFNRQKEAIFYAKPLADTTSYRRMADRDLYMIAQHDIDEFYQEVEESIPEDLKEALEFGSAWRLNTDPKKGSYCVHLHRNRSPNDPYGESIIERCLSSLIRLDNLRNAQTQISSRNMSPKHLIYADGISAVELHDLRMQVDMSMLEPADYPILTNFPVTWEVKGANDRLLQLDGDIATLNEALATGLGTTKELLTGAATYGGQRITLELMNTQYLAFREVIKNFVETDIFKPVADANGHFYHEEIEVWVEVKPENIRVHDDIQQEPDGTIRRKLIVDNKVYNHSTLRFTRLSVRDNSEVYDQLFQLHQKGGLALRYLLDIHNIDQEENAVGLLEDVGTIKDSSFNELLRAVYTGAADSILKQTNIVDRIVQALNLEVRRPASPGPSEQDASMGGMGGGGGGSLGGLDMGGGGGGMGMDMGMGGMPPGGDEMGLGDLQGPAPGSDMPAAEAGPASSPAQTVEETSSVTSSLRMVPNQTLTLAQKRLIIATVKQGKNLTKKKLKGLTSAISLQRKKTRKTKTKSKPDDAPASNDDADSAE